VTPTELRERITILFEQERTRCLNLAIAALNDGDQAEALRQGEWARYYKSRLDMLDEGGDPELVAREALSVHQARAACARAGKPTRAPQWAQ
jgi:hypothetical protein